MSLVRVCPAHPRVGDLYALASDGHILLAVGGAPDGTVRVASNAGSWSSRAQTPRGLRSVAHGPFGWVAVGEYGWIGVSTDDGESWTEVPHAASGCLHGVAVDGPRVWIVGEGGQLLGLSADRELLAFDTGTDARLGAVLVAGGVLWMAGHDGVLLKRGAGFQQGVKLSDQPLTGVCVALDGAVLVSGDGGRIFRSPDGESWSDVSPGGHEDIEDVAVLSDGTLLAVGGRSTVWVSSDHGCTWTAGEVDGPPTHLWTVLALGDGAIVVGQGGAVFVWGELSDWTRRADRFGGPRPLDAVFAGGPDGFVADRLRAYVRHFQPELPEDAGPLPELEAPDLSPAQTDGDAWKSTAVPLVKALWRGSTADHAELWGLAPPPELVAFERATHDAARWSTFVELRLSHSLMAVPPEGVNVFEQMVLTDQLNYLGTALPDTFSGLVCFGSLGDGDTWHFPVDHTFQSRVVEHWGHDEAAFSSPVADSLDALVYLCALMHADDEDALSPEVRDAAFAALRGRVAPSWHFSIEDRDPDFEPYEHPGNQQYTRFFDARAAWIVYLLRQDGVVELSDLPEHFHVSLNPALTPEQVEGRLEGAAKWVATALYTMWRAFLFDEPWLEDALVLGRKHPGRIARDCAALIDELRAGRKELGRIDDFPRLLERFRALELDPRLAEDKAAREAAEARRREERRAAVVRELEDRGWDEAFLWTCPLAELGHTLLQRMWDEPELAGLRYLRDQAYSRHNQIYRDEERDACQWTADRANGVLQAILVGVALAEAEKGSLARGHAWDCADALAASGRLDPRALPVLRELVPDGLPDDGLPWLAKRAMQVLAAVGDRTVGARVAGLLGQMPTDGGFDVVLKWGDASKEVAAVLGKVGAPEHADVLLPFALTPSIRLDKTRVAALGALAAIAPERITAEVVTHNVRRAALNNSSDENSGTLLALAQMAVHLPEDARAGLLEVVAENVPKANSYEEVQAARALLVHRLGGDAPDLLERVHLCFTQPGWKEEYTVRRRRFALQLSELVDGCDLTLAADFFKHHDPDLTRETLARCPELEAPRSLTWFDTAELDLAALRQAASLSHHAVRRLSGHGEPARNTLETVLSDLLDRVPEGVGADLLDRDRRLMRETVRGLRAMPHAGSTAALWNRALHHPCRSAKAPFLRAPPDWPELAEGMRQVLAEKWGWQESTARSWLDSQLC